MTLATKLITLFEPILAPLLAAVRRAEEFLGPDDDWVEEDRRILYEAADKFLRPLGRSTVTKKKQRDYITTVDLTPNEVETLIHNNGYERNLLSTRKYRKHHLHDSQREIVSGNDSDSPSRNDGGKQWAVGSWVLDPADTDWQHHVFIFPTEVEDSSHESSSRNGSHTNREGGSTDVYAHKEPSVRDPDAHHKSDEIEYGNPMNLYDIFDEFGVNYE